MTTVPGALPITGEVAEAFDRLDEAHQLAGQAAALLPDPEDGSDPEQVRRWCQAHTQLAHRERQRGDPTRAAERFAAVIAVAETHLGEGAELLGALNGLGMACRDAARYDEAEAAYRRAVLLAESDEPDLLVLASLFHNLGALEHARGRPAPGIVWAEGGLALREEVLGPDHPDVAADVRALGDLYRLAERRDDAETAYRRALDILRHAGQAT